MDDCTVAQEFVEWVERSDLQSRVAKPKPCRQMMAFTAFYPSCGTFTVSSVSNP
jgi:hypothetical protein